MVHQLKSSMTGLIVKVLAFCAVAITIIQFFNILYGRVNALPPAAKAAQTHSAPPPASTDDSAGKTFIKPNVELVEVKPVYQHKEVDKPLVKPELPKDQ